MEGLIEYFIPVEIRIINSMSNKDEDGFIGRYAWAAVPNSNEVINIDGNPYIVIERAWSIHPKDENLYCYLRVWPVYRSE